MRTHRAIALGLVCLLSAASFGAPPDPTKVPPELAKAKLAAIRKVYEGHWVRTKHEGKLDPEFVYRWSVRWMEAQCEASTDKAGQVAAAQDHLDRMKKLERILQASVKTGETSQAEAAAGEFYRIEAEIALARAKGR
jgi:hypothetical protein